MNSAELKPCSFWAEKLAAGHPDDLSLIEQLALQTHLASCPACSAVRAEYEAFWCELERLPAIEPRPGLPARLLEIWQEQGQGRTRGAKTASRGRIGATLASQPATAFPVRRNRRFGIAAQVLATVLVIAILLGTFLLLFTFHRSETAGQDAHTGTWKIVLSPNPGKVLNVLNAVAVVSTNDVWAVGYSSSTPISLPTQSYTSSRVLIEHWDGSKWSIVLGPNPGKMFNELDAIAALSANNVWTVGYSSNSSDGSKSQGLIEHWNGQRWSVVPGASTKMGESVHLQAIAALPASNIWIVGASKNQELIEHWNGKQWSLVPGPKSTSNTYRELDAIAAISANDIWAVGATVDRFPHPLIEHWDGSQWSIVTGQDIAGYGELVGVAALSANDIWVVGSQGSDTRQPLIEHWNGAQWSMVEGATNSNAPDNTLSGVVAISSHDVWAVGASPSGGQLLGPSLIEHWNGSRWSIVPSANLYQTSDNYLTDIARDLQSGTLWAVGYAGSSFTKESTLIERYR